MNRYSLIVAGGSGQRMKSLIPKQFIKLAGKPILMHTIERFHSFDRIMPIIVVLPENHIPEWKEMCLQFGFDIPHLLINGGETRFHSVKNGLAMVKGEGLIAIHDGVRPLVSLKTIERCFEAANLYGNAIPCIPVHETVRHTDQEGNEMIDRSNLRLIQTPQVFRSSLLRKAFEQPYDPAFTDDASVVERLGEEIKLVEGNRENIKITEPVDLIFAASVLEMKDL